MSLLEGMEDGACGGPGLPGCADRGMVRADRRTPSGLRISAAAVLRTGTGRAMLELFDLSAEEERLYLSLLDGPTPRSA